MEHHVFKHIEIIGTSAKSVEDAINHAIEKASKTLRNIEWFEVLSTRGKVENGKATEFQVIMKVGIKLEDN
jgi:flavin-binding protein dodecin